MKNGKPKASRAPHPNSLANLNHRPKPGRSRKIQITQEDEDFYKSAGDGNLTDGVAAIAKLIRESALFRKSNSPIDEALGEPKSLSGQINETQ